MEKLVVLEKKVGETPLSCAEAWRATCPQYADVPLSYAGRLDPMASGKLLVLIGDECKNQTAYHGLDKAYDFSVLFGVESDTQDVLGRLKSCPAKDPISSLEENLDKICSELTGKIELPYPKFSAKTVQGKPLHMWTLEGKLDEIEVPTRESEIYSLELTKIEILPREQVADQARAKIDTIPEVTDPRKALGNDFRRADVRKDWEHIKANSSQPDSSTIAHFHCIASSGTYMRTLASVIAQKLDTCGLAWHIHRTHIGKYDTKKRNWDLQY